MKSNSHSENNSSKNDVDVIFTKLSTLPIATQYPRLLLACRSAVQLFHDTFSPSDAALWSRMRRAIPKELNESAFIIDEMMTLLGGADDSTCSDGPPYTIIDMCSGVGYLSMFLSHLLPPARCSRIVAIDTLFQVKNGTSAGTAADDGASATTTNNDEKQRQQQQRKSRHLSSAHLTSPIHPIPIRPRKANIKKGRELRQIAHHCVDQAPGPVIILGVHLCKSLSVHTVRLFNITNVCRLYLKPCCLPGRKELRRREPPFWAFDHMPGGGFGVKTLYCSEIKAQDKDADEVGGKDVNVERALKQMGRDAGKEEDEEEGEKEEAQAEEEERGRHCHTQSDVRGHALFDRWTNLLREAADTSDEAVTAKIYHLSVQQRHFQNQYIVATR